MASSEKRSDALNTEQRRKAVVSAMSGDPRVDPITQMQLSKVDVTVILPALDEAGAIVAVLDELKSNGLRNVIVVDGHSTDGTPELAEKWGAKVIEQQGSGKSRAIATALKYVTTELVLVVDADRTYDITSIDEMIDLIQDTDEVICARARGRENIPRLNRLGNAIIGFVFNTLFSTHVRDVLSGMYLVRTSALKGMWAEGEGFSLEIEIASSVASTSRRLAEVEGNYRPRVGKPKLRRRHGLAIFGEAVKLTWRYNPPVFIFALFSALFIPAVFIDGWVAAKYLILGQKHFVWAIIGTIVGGVAIISFALAVVSLYVKRFEYRVLERLRRLEKNS